MVVNVPRGTLAKFSAGMGQANIVFHVEHLFEAAFRRELQIMRRRVGIPTFALPAA
jgi:hypothetical protein